MSPSSPTARRDASASEQAPDLSITADDQVYLHAAGYDAPPERGLVSSAPLEKEPGDLMGTRGHGFATAF